MTSAMLNQPEARKVDRALRENDGLIHYTLRRAFGRMSFEDYEDMTQELRISMYQAVLRFDPSRGVPMMAYVAICLQNAARDLMVSRRRRLSRPCEKALSLDAPLGIGQDEALISIVRDDHPSHDELVVGKVASEQALALMTPRARRLVRLKAEGLTLDTLGKQEGITRERVRQIIHKAVSSLPC